jgi:hypothetical protein
MGQSGRLFSSCSSSSWIRACDVAALMMTLSLLLVLSAHEVRGAADTPITFGMSTPLNTSLPAAELGLRFSSGIKLAFDEVNSKFGGINGHPLNLLVQEDYYNLTITMQNVGSMIAGGAFAIAGVIGAEQAQGTTPPHYARIDRIPRTQICCATFLFSLKFPFCILASSWALAIGRCCVVVFLVVCRRCLPRVVCGKGSRSHNIPSSMPDTQNRSGVCVQYEQRAADWPVHGQLQPLQPLQQVRVSLMDPLSLNDVRRVGED